jgi:aconitate hydratase
MGAEIGATTSTFGYDDSMKRYLESSGRADVAAMAEAIKEHLTGDTEVYANPEKYFDQLIEINLDELEPHLNGPFTPDKAWTISEFAKAVADNDYPVKLSVGLIGSCTNSSYEDLARAASIARQAKAKNLKVNAEFTITPGSELVRYTADRDGLLDVFESIGGVVLANACGPCIGMWDRMGAEKEEKNAIIHSFNRNFAKRADGNPNTMAFVASPELVTAMTIAGDMKFNPLTDTLINQDGVAVKLDPPSGEELPPRGFDVEDAGFQAPAPDGSSVQVKVESSSDRLQLLEPFKATTAEQLKGMRLLIKAKGKCTTDHISMAGPWLKYRGHLENISQNCYIGAVNYFNEQTNKVANYTNGNAEYMKVPSSAIAYQKAGIATVVFGEDNLGEGSSREHAAMEPRFLGVKAVIVKSFARIHETNLKKQGMLALTFVNPADYDLVRQDDVIDINGYDSFAPGKNLTIVLHHADGSTDSFEVKHSYNQQQIEWVKAGSALNKIREELAK